MTRALAAFTAAVCLYLARFAQSQPVQCSVVRPGSSLDGPHCDEGFYCDPDIFICRECHRCEDFKREPSAVYSSCVKSVVECGPCMKGLVEDHRVGNVDAQCIPRSSRDEDDGFPIYGWVLVALLCIVLLAVFAGFVWYVLNHPDTSKILASTSTLMQSRCDRTVIPPTAPEQPPPYSRSYTAVQPVSPSPQPPAPEYAPSPAFNEHHPNDEESSFIKQPWDGGEWSSRESAVSQAARVYRNPAYVRVPQPVNGYESPEYPGPMANGHDEETVESVWTPGASYDQNDNTPSGTTSPIVEGPPSTQLPALLAAARNTSLIRAPHTENVVRQDANNNGGRGSGEASSVCGEGDSNSNPGHGSSFIINVFQNINTLPQRGDGGH